MRIAVRKFDPFERAIRRQWADFTHTAGVDASLEVEPLELNALHGRLIERGGLADGSLDIAFLPTDWLAEAQAAGLIENLSPFLAASSIDGFPDAWSASLVRLQAFAGGFWGQPYLDRRTSFHLGGS
jgi:multiple sugar transport system substrate-binding protein